LLKLPLSLPLLTELPLILLHTAALLLYTMLPVVSELAVHTQGTYVAQKLIHNVNSQQELLDVCRAVFPDTVSLMQVRAWV